MKLILFLFMFFVVAVVCWLWVGCIDYMKKKNPDYEGDDFLDW